MSERFAVRSMSAPLLRVAMRAPVAMMGADHQEWHYRAPIQPERVADEHQQLVSALEAAGVEVLWMDEDDDGLADSAFTYDPSFVVQSGAILLRPGKQLRAGEVAVHERFYRTQAIPIAGRIEAPGTLEGGDMLWLDDTTIAVGEGTRTNTAGITQLREILDPDGVDLQVYQLPELDDPDACLHLLSVVNPVDSDLALVHAPLLPAGLADDMRGRGYQLLDAPADEFEASFGLSLNVLATAPRQCLAIAGFTKTHDVLRRAGCVVTTFDGDALCVNCEGGPTCLTRPVLRA